MANSRKSNSTELVARALDLALSRHCQPHVPLSVAYSGGLDSSVLLHSLIQAVGIGRLLAVHVNHGLSSHADEWQRHCEAFCSRFAVSFHAIKVTVPRNTSEGLEAAARRVRYDALARKAPGAILLAHHADDQAETLLHNLLRGSGVRGLAAMPEMSGRLVRPFLSLRRNTLIDYARHHDLVWCNDESNGDNRFTRNYLRNTVLPAIAQRFPQAAEQMMRCAARMGEAQKLLDELAENDAGAVPLVFPFPSDILISLPEHRARNLLLVLLHRNGLKNPGEQRLRNFIGQLFEARADRSPEIRLGAVCLKRKKRQIVIEQLHTPLA